MKRPSYKQAVNWIAGNDEPGILDREEMMNLISVVMIADLFEVEPIKVADDVIKARIGDWGTGTWA